MKSSQFIGTFLIVAPFLFFLENVALADWTSFLSHFGRKPQNTSLGDSATAKAAPVKSKSPLDKSQISASPTETDKYNSNPNTPAVKPSPILDDVLPGQVPKERKVYVSPDHTVYWPIEKPVWIRLASGAGDEANSYLLSQLFRGTDEDSKDLYNKGIKLEIPGKQFIRWVNHFSKNEVSYQFSADGLPPVAQVSFTDAPEGLSKEDLIFGRNLSFNLTAQDEQSGVRHVGYSLNDEPFNWYEKPISVYDEGSYKLTYYAIDHVGYASKFETVKFRVNLTPPNTELVLDKNSKGTVFGPKVEFTLIAKDRISGIKDIFYKFNTEKDYRKYSGPLKLDELAEGNHIIYFYSEDNVANRETPKQSVFFLERSPPEIGHSFLGDLSVKDQVSYISPRTRVRLDASDFHSSVKQITYHIGEVEDKAGKVYEKVYNDAFDMGHSSQTPLQTVFYKAENEFGIISPEKSFKVFVDSRSPKTQHQFKGKVFTQSASVYFISHETKIELTAIDEDSGLQSTLYQLGDQPTTTYSGPFTIEKEGRNLLRYWSIDKVNNQESSHAVLVVVDRTPPNILGVFSVDPIRKSGPTTNARALASNKAKVKVNTEEKPTEITEVVYPVGTSFLINATDGLSGVQEIQVSVDHEPLRKYEGPIVFKKEKSYEVTVVAKDQVGNTSQEKFIFRIEKK